MPTGATERPYLRLAPRALAPVVLTCEHATRRLPVRRGLGSAQRCVLASHWGWDIGAWELTRHLARRLATSAIGGRWSRLWIDLNRRIDDPTLIRGEADGIELPWNRGLTPDGVERRALACHVPYHVEIDRLILRRLVRGVRPLLLAVHSFTPVYDGRRRRFDVGVLYERHRPAAVRLARALGEAGLSVRHNQPYSGMAGMMYAAERHGTHHGLPCLELEVNHARFDEPDFAPRLASVAAPVLAAVAAESPPVPVPR